MKKSILVLAVSSAILLTNCKNSAEKVENAQENVNDANKDLNKAEEDYQREIEDYRRETANEISENERKIEELRARADQEKKEVRADYNKKVDELQERNTRMKTRMDEYKADNREGWQNFKKEWRHDMDELGQAFRDIGKDNVPNKETTNHNK
jgi:peptidoglycan hydrolase CwlO-like protein